MMRYNQEEPTRIVAVVILIHPNDSILLIRSLIRLVSLVLGVILMLLYCCKMCMSRNVLRHKTWYLVTIFQQIYYIFLDFVNYLV